MVRFKAKIGKLGINPVIDPPEGVLAAIFEQAGRSKGPVPVRGTLDGAAFAQTLVKYGGKWRLYVNGEMMKASDVRVGDFANIELEYDPKPRTLPVPPRLEAALRSDPIAAAAFAVLTPGRRKEILRYLGSLKTEASLERNIERVLVQLRNKLP